MVIHVHDISVLRNQFYNTHHLRRTRATQFFHIFLGHSLYPFLTLTIKQGESDSKKDLFSLLKRLLYTENNSFI